MSNRTCACLSVAKVITACERAIDSIETKRASMLEDRILYYQDKRRASWLYRWRGEMSRDRAIAHVNDGCWLRDHRWYAWGTLDTAERLLALAKATHALEMDISSEDFSHIARDYQ